MSATQNIVTSLKRLVGAARRQLQGEIPRQLIIADVPASPDAPMCNVCGFVPSKGNPRLCPGCGTNQRQRSFRQVFAKVLEQDAFGGGMLDNALLLSPGAVERSLLGPKFRHHVVSSLYQTYPAEVFVRADVRDLAPFSDKQFDYVQACNVLDYVPEMRRAIEAAHRVTRANGFFVFLIPEQNLIEGHAEIAVSVHTSVTGKYWPDKASVPSVSVGRETLTEMLKSVGFQPREIQFTEPLSRRPCTWWVCRRL